MNKNKDVTKYDTCQKDWNQYSQTGDSGQVKQQVRQEMCFFPKGNFSSQRSGRNYFGGKKKKSYLLSKKNKMFMEVTLYKFFLA